MATIYNSTLTRELIDAAKIQTSKDKIPSELAEKVVPVMEVNPKLLRRVNIIKGATAVNTTPVTIFTTQSGKDFYCTAATLSLIKDVNSTSVYSSIQCSVDGLVVNLLKISSLTLTPQNDSAVINFNPPIKIDRSTAVVIASSTNVANITNTGTIFGYYDDTSNA